MTDGRASIVAFSRDTRLVGPRKGRRLRGLIRQAGRGSRGFSFPIFLHTTGTSIPPFPRQELLFWEGVRVELCH
jgi:hypothetical protein